MAISITRVNPRTGKLERPWRNRDGFFVLGDPIHGAQKHHDKNAVKVATLEEVAERVRDGFSVRMTDGEAPPSLISPDSLRLEEVKNEEAGQLFTDTDPKPPFTKTQMMEELKVVLLTQASQIAHAGKIEYAVAFMGFEPEDPSYPYGFKQADQVDLTRFDATHYLDRAYDFGFQVERYWDWQDGLAEDIKSLMDGATPVGRDGWSSPVSAENSFCRHAADLAFGRWKLEEGLDLSIRELALLAGITEAAVRNALSKERIAVTNGEVDHTVAQSWLRQRRSFVPTRKEEADKERWVEWKHALLNIKPFAEAFAQILRDYPMSEDVLSAKAQVSSEFIKKLLAGRPDIDAAALQRVGEALDLDAPHFAGAAVQAALRSSAAQ